MALHMSRRILCLIWPRRVDVSLRPTKLGFFARVCPLASLAMLLMLMTCETAQAHRWFMHEIRFQGGTDFPQCLADTYKAAQNVMRIMQSKGYSQGSLKQGQKSIRID